MLILISKPFEMLYTSAKILILWNNSQNRNGSFPFFSLWDETEAIFYLLLYEKEENFQIKLRRL